jgi:DNA-binding NarL/FixJ family response regulator
MGLAVLQVVREAELPTRVVVSSPTKDTQLMAEVARYKPDAIVPKPLDPALLHIELDERR